MSFFDNIFLNSLLVVLPICFYLLLMLRIKKYKNVNFLISLACFTSLYLIYRYSVIIPGLKNLLFINIPLIILIVYKRKFASLVLSSLIVMFYYKIFNFSLYPLVIEYMIYFIVFYLLKCKNKSRDFIILLFIFIKGIILTIEYMYLFNGTTIDIFYEQFLNLLMFYLITTIIIYTISKSEDIIKYSNVLQELEKEKVLKSSLFKITHEVKNPIAVCKGYLSMLDYDDYKKTKRYIEIIKSEINRTLDIMDNFSMYTKININKDIMDVSYLIEEVVSSVKILLDEKNINLSYNVLDELYIEADYNRLKQVLINVIKNASEAIGKNGDISIGLKESRDFVCFIIKDNGCGICEEDLKRIGELFYSSKDKGCGIGVPLSIEIVKLHNGVMKYESEIGVGTKVTIKIPKK